MEVKIKINRTAGVKVLVEGRMKTAKYIETKVRKDRLGRAGGGELYKFVF
jgi:hypothetical protein